MRAFDADKYEYVKKEWIEKKVNDFLETISSFLIEDRYLMEFAEAIAWANYNDESCQSFLSSHNLDANNVLCYLFHITKSKKYGEEIDDAFLDDVESSD